MEQPAEISPGSNEPFMKAERIDQLSEVDHDITTLLELTGKAIKTLGKSKNSHTASSNGDSTVQVLQDVSAENSTEAFKEAMNDFLSVLHSVDVRLKRQIMALEEAGIINFKERGRDGAPESTKGTQKASLEPNGVGNIGNLDVGWLNSRSSKVERDMEAELWARAKSHLEKLSGADSQAQIMESADVTIGD